MSSVKKVVLAYSGGLDTTVILHWLKEQYDCEVVCFAADLGQGEELEPLEAKAAAAGSRIYIDDLRAEFVRDFVWPAVRANALYEGVYLLGTSLARPLISKRMIEIAWDEVPRIALWQPAVNVGMRGVEGYEYWFHRQLDGRSLKKV